MASGPKPETSQCKNMTKVRAMQWSEKLQLHKKEDEDEEEES